MCLVLISTDPDAAYREGWRVRLWDFLFYASFGATALTGPSTDRRGGRA
jgi:ABC-type Mn2+/Zn2+ transport system permease subunit